MRPRLAVSLFVLVLGWTLCAAQSAPPPPKLEPLPEPPPPPSPPAAQTDPELEPQVTIIHREEETIEEFRVKGRLTMIKVTPRHGRPYYLVADSEGAFWRRDSLDSGLRVPMWVLFSF